MKTESEHQAKDNRTDATKAISTILVVTYPLSLLLLWLRPEDTVLRELITQWIAIHGKLLAAVITWHLAALRDRNKGK